MFNYLISYAKAYGKLESERERRVIVIKGGIRKIYYGPCEISKLLLKLKHKYK